MEERAYNVSLEKNPRIVMRVIPGHFTASSTHSNHYLDLSSLKSNALVARDVARELAIPYLSSTLVDTIVCMGRTEVIGAYLAEELLQSGQSVVNEGHEIYVVTPITNDIGTMTFQSSMVKHISNRNVILMTTWVLSGRTLDRASDFLGYYGAKIAGISSLFMVNVEKPEQKVNPLFTSDDIPDYRIYSPRKCDLCRSGLKLDAHTSSEGYTKL